MELPDEVVEEIKQLRKSGCKYTEIYPKFLDYELNYLVLNEIFGVKRKPRFDDGDQMWF